MIASLADAWSWYESAKKLTRAMQRLGERHWNALPWGGELGRDERLRHLESAEIVERSDAVLADLDDLCILLFFSVFEALVRQRVLDDIAVEVSLARHPALQRAIDNLRESIEHGGFFQILDFYKGFDANLVEQVNQVRIYRNWVAHGRRGSPHTVVNPQAAYLCLQRFLDQLPSWPLGTTAPTVG